MRSTLLLSATLVLGLATAAQAQSGLPDVLRTERFTLDLAAGALGSADYLGSDDYKLRVLPLARASWRDRVTLDPVEGLRADLVAAGGWGAGPILRPRYGREAKENAALAGLGDVDLAAEAGGFVSRQIGPWQLRADVVHDVSGVSGGTVGTLSVGRWARLPFAAWLVRAEVAVADRDFHQTYFGVDALQAQRSGYPEYRPGGGVERLGLRSVFVTPLGRRTALATYLGYNRLVRDAARAPFVRRAGSPNEAQAGVFLVRRFGR